MLEKNDHLGGGATSGELAAPGYRHDWHSATHIVIQANPLLCRDELGLMSKFGLRYTFPEATYSTIFDDHDSIITYTDIDRTCESIARVSPRDADAYRAFAAQSAALPSRPIFASHNNAQWDASRTPPGGGALAVFGFGPWALRDGGTEAWDTRKPELARWLRDSYGQFCENLDDDNIVAWRFDTPLDLSRHSPTFQHGDVGGVGKYFFQIGGHGPTPELAQYAVPGAEGLYLAGTFMHPPGGVTGGGRAHRNAHLQ